MKCYHQLECDWLSDIQSQSLGYLQSLYNFQDQQSLATDLWLKIDTRSFVTQVPALITWFRSMKLSIRETALTVVNDKNGVGLHIDELPVTAKINVPLCNYQGTTNEWWSVPDCLMSSIAPVINKFGQAYYNLSSIDLDQCRLRDSIQMTGPIVFNSQIPHRIVPGSGASFPRVVLTCMFMQEPIQYLQ